MMKPKVLYHASSNKNLEVLEPRAGSVRDSTEGSLIFATPLKAMAVKFLVPKDDSWTRSGAFGEVEFIVISDKEKFNNLDKGGAVYTMPSETFETDPTKGRGTQEWTGKEKVVPTGKEVFRTGLKAMIDHRVQVFFVDEETFDRIDQSKDHGNKIIMGLESENKKLGLNYEKIPSITGE